MVLAEEIERKIEIYNKHLIAEVINKKWCNCITLTNDPILTIYDFNIGFFRGEYIGLFTTRTKKSDKFYASNKYYETNTSGTRKKD